MAYLSELLLLEETEGFFGREIAVELSAPEGSPTLLRARIRGEVFDPTRHAAHEAVKAITYHGLTFDPERGRARVIVDV